jgi:hypothetical protein
MANHLSGAPEDQSTSRIACHTSGRSKPRPQPAAKFASPLNIALDQLLRIANNDSPSVFTPAPKASRKSRN